MDLLHFPVHHQFTGYNEQQLLDNGIVYAHSLTGVTKRTYYTGWQCGNIPGGDAANRQRTEITSLDQFLQLYLPAK